MSFNPSKRANYEEKKKKILDIMKSFTHEERILWNIDGNYNQDITKDIVEVVRLGGVNKVAHDLGISEDWLNYYIQHQALNAQRYKFLQAIKKGKKP